ncbi:MAG: sialate O-acetylesterase [bacterium]
MKLYLNFFRTAGMFLIMFSAQLFAQTVQYHSIPNSLQLYPRNSQDSAAVVFSGDVLTTGFDSISVEKYKNNILISRLKSNLVYSQGKAPFNLTHKIHAECSEYKFKIFVNTVLVKTVDSVVSGDVFVVMGQSNAIEIRSNYTFTNEYCRTFGILTANYNNDPYNAADTLWAKSRADIGGTLGGIPNVGVWTLQLQKNIKEIYNLPTCFINGGRASAYLSIQLRNNSNPEDLTSTYGKLLYRVRKAKVNNNVKSIIWYGGESDGYPAGYQNYISNWNIIYSQWVQDYPGFSRIFSLQVRPGCSSDEDLDKLREKQRQIGALYNNIELFSTSGISEHYGCHHGTNGYIELGNFLFRNIAKKFYNGTDTVNILPPNIRVAFYNTARNKIKILFDNSIVRGWPNDTLYGDVMFINHSMKTYFYLNGVSGNVSGGSVSGDTLILNLINPSTANKLSYLPATRDHTDTQVFEGPFLRNPRGLGALSFFEFPIQDSLILPVELSTFGFSVTKRDVSLYWSTNSEQNNSGFEIQRFQQQVNSSWEKAGYINGNGSTNSVNAYSFVDRGLISGRYLYRLKQIDFNGNYKYYDLNNEVVISIPLNFNLYQNYPNPFNPVTKINYDIPFDSKIVIKVIDNSGKEAAEILNEVQNAGYHTVSFDGSNFPSGIYYYKLIVSSGNQKFVSTRKMLLIK